MVINTRARTIEFAIFFSGYFFYRFQYGTENEFISLNLATLQILVVIYALTTRPIKGISLTFVSAISFLLLMLQIFFYYLYITPNATLPGENEEYLLASAKLLIYITFTCLYASSIKAEDIESLFKAFLNLSRISVIIAVLSLVIYHISGIALLLNVYSGEYLIRPQAFLSEPSAFAPIAAILIIYGCVKKSVKDIFCAATIVTITFSPIVIICSALSIFLYVFLYKIKSTIKKAAIITVALLITLPIATLDCAPLVVSTDSIERTLGRVSCGVQVIFNSSLREQLELQFTNQRLTSTFIAIDLAKYHDGLFSGFGMNSSSIFMPALFGEIRENSLWVSAFLFYGIPGLIALLAITTISIFKTVRSKNDLAIILIPLLIASTINSAGGFYLYAMLFFTIATVLSLKDTHPMNSLSYRSQKEC